MIITIRQYLFFSSCNLGSDDNKNEPEEEQHSNKNVSFSILASTNTWRTKNLCICLQNWLDQ